MSESVIILFCYVVFFLGFFCFVSGGEGRERPERQVSTGFEAGCVCWGWRVKEM